MRIAIVAPPYYEIPPAGYGGTELVCFLLAEGLLDRGHDVTVIGAGSGHTRARFIATFAEVQQEGGAEGARAERVHALAAARAIRELRPDVVHSHITTLLDTPDASRLVVTMHGAVRGPDATSARLAEIARRGTLVAISRAQANSARQAGWQAIVHNGIDLSRYPDSGHRTEAVLYLGRISQHKGTHIAIDAAEAAGRPLVIAGSGTIPEERRYFETQIRPRLGRNVTWTGEVGFDQKVSLLSKSACLLFPARWDEPFGLVMIEAMACGTPVVALSAGAVPELVVTGETGVLCQSPAELSTAIGRAAGLDPDKCRAHVAAHFTADRMVSAYEELYDRICSR